MNAFLIAFVVFLFQLTVSMFFGKKIKPLVQQNAKIKKELEDVMKEKEEKYSLENIGSYRLRVLTLFTKITDEDEKEEMRDYMKSVVNKRGGKPRKLISLQAANIIFSALCIYCLLLFVNSPPVLWLSIIVNILIIFFWISRKRWIFSVLFGVVGYFIYPMMSGHLITYIGLNMLKTIFFSIKKKSK